MISLKILIVLLLFYLPIVVLAKTALFWGRRSRVPALGRALRCSAIALPLVLTLIVIWYALAASACSGRFLDDNIKCAFMPDVFATWSWIALLWGIILASAYTCVLFVIGALVEWHARS